MSQINASIVLYHNNREQLKKVIDSFLSTKLDVLLYLVDNSLSDELKEMSDSDSRIIYIFNNANIGYGAGHNIAIRKSLELDVKYHIVLNPDLYFENTVINELFQFMELNPKVGNVIPKVLYPNGDIQYLCKLLPSPMNWIGRFILQYRHIQYLYDLNYLFEMKFANFDNILEVPYMSGAFMFLRLETIKKSGLFDENIFLHTEDVDLSRRMYEHGKNIYFPKVTIYHEHNREAYRNKKIMLLQVKSIIYYFNKWGWLFDKKRVKINNETISKSIIYK